MAPIESAEKTFLDLQNRYRGIGAELKSRRYVQERRIPQTRRFRSDQKKILLEARYRLSPDQYGPFLAWAKTIEETQLLELVHAPVGSDDLAGVHDSPKVSLEREMLWTTHRILNEQGRISAFRQSALLIEECLSRGNFEEGISGLEAIDAAFGSSFWSVQLRIGFEQLAGGLEQQKRHTAALRNIFKRGLLPFIAYHTSVRNEEKSTTAKFNEDITSRIERHTKYTDDVKTYLRYKLASIDPIDGDEVGTILRVDQSHNILDLYESFVYIAQLLSRRVDLSASRDNLRRCLELLPLDLDARLLKVRLQLGMAIDFNRLPPRNREISDLLLSGFVGAAGKAFRRYANGDASLDALQLIYGAHALRPRPNSPMPRRMCKAGVARLLALALAPSANSEAAFQQISKFSVNFGNLDFARGIADYLALVRRQSPLDDWSPWRIGLHCRDLGVEDFPPEVTAPIDPSPTQAVWRQLAAPSNSACSSLAEGLFRSAGLVIAGEFKDASDQLAKLKLDAEGSSIEGLTANLALHALIGRGETSRAVDLVADTFTRNQSAGQCLPVSGTLAPLSYQEFREAEKPLAAPIALHLLWQLNGADQTESALRFAIKTALRKLGKELPSQVTAVSALVPEHQLIYFLSVICRPHFLDSVPAVRSSRAVLEERSAILNLLRVLCPGDARIHSEELMALSADLLMAEGKWIVDHSRIHVDTGALRRWADRQVQEDFERYKDLVEVDAGPQASFDEVLKELAESILHGKNPVHPETEADAVLMSMMRRLGDEFLTNGTFGLDFYLSKRIRHQSFIGQIRGPLEFAHFITTRENSNSPYNRNEYWLERFNQQSPDIVDEIANALNRCAYDFDEILRAAKDERLHIRTAEHPHGLIRLDISPHIVRMVKSIASYFPENFGATYDVVVAAFWAVLTPSLESARLFLSSELKSRLTDRIDQARAEIRSLAGSDPAFVAFDIEFGKASTEVQRALDDAASWFSYTSLETHKKSFTLEEALRIGTENALRSQRSFEPEINQSISCDCDPPFQLDARSLVFIHDVLFIALDNVRAHSGERHPVIDIAMAHESEAETLTLSFKSDSRATQRAANERRASAIRDQIAGGAGAGRASREGGSGFMKLNAVVSPNPAGRLKFGFLDDGRFHLEVTFGLIFSPQAIGEAA